MEANNLIGAKAALDERLTANPADLPTLKLAHELATTDAEKAKLKAHLANAVEADFENVDLVEFAWEAAGTDEDRQIIQAKVEELKARPVRNYRTATLLTLFAYIFSFASADLTVVGLILNIYFMDDAKRDKQQGITVRDADGLKVLLMIGAVVFIGRIIWAFVT